MKIILVVTILIVSISIITHCVYTNSVNDKLNIQSANSDNKMQVDIDSTIYCSPINTNDIHAFLKNARSDYQFVFSSEGYYACLSIFVGKLSRDELDEFFLSEQSNYRDVMGKTGKLMVNFKGADNVSKEYKLPFICKEYNQDDTLRLFFGQDITILPNTP